MCINLTRAISIMENVLISNIHFVIKFTVWSLVGARRTNEVWKEHLKSAFFLPFSYILFCGEWREFFLLEIEFLERNGYLKVHKKCQKVTEVSILMTTTDLWNMLKQIFLRKCLKYVGLFKPVLMFGGEIVGKFYPASL